MHSLRTLLLAITATGALILSQHASALSFAPPSSYPAGGLDPGGATLADFNRDGKLDVVQANASFRSSKAAVLLGLGDGALGEPAKVTVNLEPLSTAVADLNHDGYLDFVTANAISTSITVVLGNGDGTFEPAANYKTTGPAAGIAIGDFNNDGHPDIAVCNPSDPSSPQPAVQVLLGAGDGKFGAAVGYSVGVSRCFRIVTADFNGDGNLDLAVTEQTTNAVRILMGAGNGTFVVSPNIFSVPEKASFIAAADLNHDGRADLIATSFGEPRITILLGRGDFDFERAPDTATGADAGTIAVADFNGDGLIDFVVDSFKNNAARLYVFPGHGDGTFESAVEVNAGTTEVSVAAGDLNGDGKPDLLSLNGGGRNTISTYLNTTDFPSAGNLVNVSTRLRVSGGENVLIAGLIIQGSEPKRLIVRGIGPDLSQQGVADPLQNPTIELVNGEGVRIGFNDNWRSSQEAEIIATGIAPKDNRDAAFLATVPTGLYTAIVRSADETTGVALVEAYDLAPGGNSHFVNISTRGFVSSDPNVMIGGFIVPNGPAVKLVVRGIGPSLSSNGVTGALQDPTLELRNSAGALVYSNDNWRTTQPSELSSIGIAPLGEKDSALLVKLQPGDYTAILRGKNNTSGIGLIEVFRLQ